MSGDFDFRAAFLEKHRVRDRARDRARWPSRAPAIKRARVAANHGKNAVRPFIAIDSEGGSHGDPYTLDDGRIVQPHKSFLWGAGGIDGAVAWLYSPKPLNSIEIIEFLLAQKAAHPDAIFISFSFGYDVGQIVAGLPFEKAWELQSGLPFVCRDGADSCEARNPKTGDKYQKNQTRHVWWKNYRLQYIKGKWLALWKGAGKGRPFIKIYDVFGFFQCSFLKAVNDTPGAVSPDELAVIRAGKAKRGDFDHGATRVEETKAYTRTELMALCRMMGAYRDTFVAQKINLSTWSGAGSIASALMKREKIKPHLGEIAAEGISEQQEWAHHAFAGGRIELIQDGVDCDGLWNYDLASAYPDELSSLSSMEGGTWVQGSNKPDDIRSIDRLSIVRLRATFVHGCRFYPLFYRTPQGRIYFPRVVYGTYMQREAVAAIDFAALFGGKIEIEKVWEFRPATDVKPFGFIKDIFALRLTFPKGDLAGKVLKLGMNSCYGKLAQARGTYGKTPTFANPFYAAAITAGVRARMFEAACRDPLAIVMFATDGIVSQRPLPLVIPAQKTLGGWEETEKPLGGVFVHSGVYCFHGENAGETRGFRPDDVAGSTTRIILETIPEKWKRGVSSFAFQVKLYATLGLSITSREAWARCGSWITAPRELKLDSAGVKRYLPLDQPKLLRRRHKRLIPTEPADIFFECLKAKVDVKNGLPLSAPRAPDWLNHDFGDEMDDEDEQLGIECGFLPY